MHDIYHLAYVSISTLGDNEAFVRNEVQDILEASQRNNPPKQITGALLYSGNHFCQLLEGPHPALQTTFEHIVRDDRHEAVNVLFFDPAPSRLFGVWAMAYAGMESKPRYVIPGVRRSKDEIYCRDMGKNMVDTLARMVQERSAVLGSTAIERV